MDLLSFSNREYMHQQELQENRGFKIAKSHVTLMVTSNMNRDKEDLFLTGKAGSPRYFENVKMLLIQYNFSTNAWMTEKMSMEDGSDVGIVIK